MPTHFEMVDRVNDAETEYAHRADGYRAGTNTGEK